MITSDDVDRRQIDRDLSLAVAAHRDLLADIDEREAAGTLDSSQPSLLPDWTVGHVLTHLARNADSHVRMFEGAIAGTVADQYVGGPAGRRAAIDEGARRVAAVQVRDVRGAVERLETTWDLMESLPDAVWARAGRGSSGDLMALHDLPFRRLREVLVHRVDLGLGFGWDDLPPEYVRLELRRREMAWAARRPMGMTNLPEPVLRLAPPQRLAWLTGRLVLPDADTPPDLF